jgi:hypothetical protein
LYELRYEFKAFFVGDFQKIDLLMDVVVDIAAYFSHPTLTEVLAADKK